MSTKGSEWQIVIQINQWIETLGGVRREVNYRGWYNMPEVDAVQGT
jgi:hypothetical protein